MKKKIANAKARMVFYGMRYIQNARMSNAHLFRRYYVAVETPDVVVEVKLILPNDYWSMKKKIDIDGEMHKMAKKYFPKAEIFMFYNRVSSQGIMPPKPAPFLKEKYTIEKEITNKSK